MLDIAFSPKYASLYGFVWAFKPIRYSQGLASLQRVISRARHALLSVLLAFGIVLLAAASLAYLLERNAQPELFGSIPQALWWAIVTLTTTGYGDVTPVTPAGRVLAGVVMVSGILVFALWAGILASGYAEELRRREFLRTWDLVAKVPFFRNVGRRSSPTSRVYCGRATIRHERRSCGAASAATACILLPRARSRCGCAPNRCGSAPASFLARSRF